MRFFGRPFGSAPAMDAAIIEAVAARVRPDDDLRVVGDLAFGKGPGALPCVRGRFDQIPGRKHLVVGNHDARWAREDLPWASAGPLAGIAGDGRAVVLCHCPMLAWNGARRSALHLFGHVHNDWMGPGNSVNVGVDVWGHEPVTLKDAQRRAAKLPVNRHRADVEPREAGEVER